MGIFRSEYFCTFVTGTDDETQSIVIVPVTQTRVTSSVNIDMNKRVCNATVRVTRGDKSIDVIPLHVKTYYVMMQRIVKRTRDL